MKRKITISFYFAGFRKYFLVLFVLMLSTYVRAQTPCSAEFSYYAISNPDSVHFYPLSTSESFYYWSFGDGTTSTQATPWHYYSSSGTYIVCLYASDSGNYCNWCDTIVVGSPPCSAEFSYYAISNPDSLHFYP